MVLHRRTDERQHQMAGGPQTQHQAPPSKGGVERCIGFEPPKGRFPARWAVLWLGTSQGEVPSQSTAHHTLPTPPQRGGARNRWAPHWWVAGVQWVVPQPSREPPKGGSPAMAPPTTHQPHTSVVSGCRPSNDKEPPQGSFLPSPGLPLTTHPPVPGPPTHVSHLLSLSWLWRHSQLHSRRLESTYVCHMLLCMPIQITMLETSMLVQCLLDEL